MTLPRIEDLIPLLPGAGAIAILAVVGALLASGQADARRRNAIGFVFVAVACGAGMLATWWGTHGGIPAFPGSSSERTLWGLVGAGLVVGLMSSLLPAVASRVLHLIVGLGLTYFVLKTLVERPADAAGAIALPTAMAFGGAIAIYAWIAEFSDGHEKPFEGLVCLSLAFGAAGQLALEFGAAALGQLAGTVAMGVGPVAGLVLIVKVPTAATRLLQFSGALALATLGIVVLHYVDVPPPRVSIALVGAAACSAYLGRWSVLAERPMLRPAVVVGLAVVLSALAVWIGIDALPPAEDDPYAEFK